MSLSEREQELWQHAVQELDENHVDALEPLLFPVERELTRCSELQIIVADAVSGGMSDLDRERAYGFLNALRESGNATATLAEIPYEYDEENSKLYIRLEFPRTNIGETGL